MTPLELTDAIRISPAVINQHQHPDRSFQDDVIDRLARIETRLEHTTDHEKRIETLEKWPVRLTAVAAVFGMIGSYVTTPLLNAIKSATH